MIDVKPVPTGQLPTRGIVVKAEEAAVAVWAQAPLQGGGCAGALHGRDSSVMCLVGPLLRNAHMGLDRSREPAQVYAT